MMQAPATPASPQTFISTNKIPKVCKTQSKGSSITSVAMSTPSKSSIPDPPPLFHDVARYIPLGCLHLDTPVSIDREPNDDSPDWIEISFSNLPDEMKVVIGKEATRLLDAKWIRSFLHSPKKKSHGSDGSLLRVYLAPEDWGQRYITRKSKSLQVTLRELLAKIDTSPEAWSGNLSDGPICYFDRWASPENVSLYYVFNKLPSPTPSPDQIRDRFSRNSVWGLLEYASSLPADDSEEPFIRGLRTKLYPYQARSASMMIQKEAAPQLQLDPRLEIRTAPTGEKFYFGARDGTFIKEPPLYDTNRGGILAETMGLGKTIICLAVILATKGHMPQIPPPYRPSPPIRSRVGSLAQMAANTIGHNSIPGKAYLEQLESTDNIDLSNCKSHLEKNVPYYEIPYQVIRVNRKTIIPPPRQLILCGGTLIVVPRNLLHQWQTEIRKHLVGGSLKILVMDTKSKRAPKAKVVQGTHDYMELRHDLPSVTALSSYDVVLFTRNRFEQEIQFDAVEGGRTFAAEVSSLCECPRIGSTRIRDCLCNPENNTYETPLKKLHWLRIIIDEGHNFSSGMTNAVLVAKQLEVDRRWVVSGTPAKNLVGVEVDLSAFTDNGNDPGQVRDSVVEQRKGFNLEADNTKAAKALGSLASNFLMVRPWCDSNAEGGLEWDDYIYRHEHQNHKTYSSFSNCFLRTLEGLVVKTRPEDVERDVTLPPMRHRTVYLKPCWFDKMTANLFVHVLRANAITSERTDVDYLFHKNSVKARHSLIRNLRQSNFTWTGFSSDMVNETLKTSLKYLSKEDKSCSIEDEEALRESMDVISQLLQSQGWLALSQAHEVGLAVDDWPAASEESFAFAYPERPSMIGLSQMLEGQAHVDRQILLEEPSDGLELVGQAAKAKLVAIQEAENELKQKKNRQQPKDTDTEESTKAGVPSSCVGDQPLTSRRAEALLIKPSPKKSSSAKKKKTETTDCAPKNTPTPQKPKPAEKSAASRPKKRRLTLADETAQLPTDSPLSNTRIVGTTSAKLTYLMEMVTKHQATDKILIFYDGDNAAYYLAQCLEALYINHRIYARQLDNTKRSEYVTLFNEDPDVRVLLIDVACGALGLNLNAASIVLIVNPINRPSVEAQAIKRAHRIGQTKEVLVETLVLEGTIEEAIFKRAQKMSRHEHLEAKTLEDDAGITKIIQNAKILPIAEGEASGRAQFALLNAPQQVFGRPGREKYHKYGQVEAKSPEKPNKRRKTKDANSVDLTGTPSTPVSSSSRMPMLQLPSGSTPYSSSLFGEGAIL
jgi:SNF2 family DNA or RNA helicase